MNKKSVVNIVPEETRMALIEDGEIMEAAVERTTAGHLVGNIYKGKVKILPSGLKEGNSAILGAASLIWNEHL